MNLLGKILDYRNVEKAYRQVVRNRGCSGVDGMTTTQLYEFMQDNWDRIKHDISIGHYIPQSVLGVEIPKSSGGKRLLGIPTVIDRLIQQSIHQVLSPIFEEKFSEYSYGFRPGRSAHQAVIKSLRNINEGYRDIIDLDLKSFFDTVNHDYLMSLFYNTVKDRMLSRLIRRYLQSNIMLGGLSQQREKGTPQGSPLSPLLSNIVLNELDKELDRRGLRFVRYADDCSIFLRSKRSAYRVKRSIIKFIEEKLHLKVNESKTKICRPTNYFTLGYGFVPTYKKGEKGKYNLRVSPDSYKQFKRKVKIITRKTSPLSFNQRIGKLNTFTRGWINYFKYAHALVKLGRLDAWIRNRLRYVIWKQWKKPNRRMISFIRMGVSKRDAYSWSRSHLGGWAIAQSPIMLTTITLDRLRRRGYLSLLEQYQKSRCTVPSEYQLKFSFT